MPHQTEWRRRTLPSPSRVAARCRPAVDPQQRIDDDRRSSTTLSTSPAAPLRDARSPRTPGASEHVEDPQQRPSCHSRLRSRSTGPRGSVCARGGSGFRSDLLPHPKQCDSWSLITQPPQNTNVWLRCS
jgi:hypothetical protein